MAKKLALFFSYAVHPLLSTFLGLLIIYNSGSSLSVLQPEVKKISLIVVGLFTLIFPALLVIVLYLTKAIKDPGLIDKKDRMLTLSLIFIFYLFTFLIMRGIPQLTSGHVLYMLCPPIVLILLLILERFYFVSIHTAGIGMLLALQLILVIFLGASIQFIFISSVLAGGLLGSSRLFLQHEKPGEVLAGFGIGFLPTFALLTAYVL